MTMLLLDKEFTNEQLSVTETADLRNVSAAVWDRVTSYCQAQQLRLYHIKLNNLDGIQRLTKTTHLPLDWATKIESLAPVYQMTQLEYLSVADFSKLSDISGINSLNSLTELHLSGNRGSLSPKLRLASIAPVIDLDNLVSFGLANASLDDDDITPLASCSKLRHLHLSNQFDRKQVAFLAKRLNHQLKKPLTSNFSVGIPCSKCGKEKFMFIGRRMPCLCKVCDAVRFVKLDLEFTELVNKA